MPNTTDLLVDPFNHLGTGPVGLPALSLVGIEGVCPALAGGGGGNVTYKYSI